MKDGSHIGFRIGRVCASGFVLLLLLSAGPWLQTDEASAQEPTVFSWAELVEKARVLATAGYKKPENHAPQALLDMDYDQWRDIRFQPEKAYWHDEGLPFELQFFHLGLYYDKPVQINTIDEWGMAKPVPFSADYFNYGKNTFPEPLPADLNWAGFRIHYPIKARDYKDEVAVFLGASYFRAVGKDHHYGLSARGLAVDVAAQSGEEFPYFREFWIEKPTPESTSIVVYALLDSFSTTGAYKFTIIPGQDTVMEVESVLFQRHRVQKLCIAPLTSMFLYGENGKHPKADFRPEVHDSDGLLVAYHSGEWLWRPLVPAYKLRVNSLLVGDGDLAGFGLIQRDVDFDHYQDLEARYDLRPSVWIAPKGNWGPGRVELVEIPTDKEIYDNVVSFWVPETIPPVGEPMAFNYTLTWHTPGRLGPPAGRVTATRTAQVANKKGAIKIVIDFEGGELEALESAEGMEAVISAGPQAVLKKYQLIKNVVTDGWRLVFQIDPEEGPWTEHGDAEGVIELRTFLKKGDSVLTETWSYGVQP